MKISLRSLVFAGSLLLLLPTAVMAQSSDRDAVDLVMQKFMRAYKADDHTLISEIFRKDGVMIGYSASRGSNLHTRTGEEFAKGFDGSPADDEAQRKRSYEILDVTENTAVVKVLIDYPTWKGLDYLALSKIDGKWMMVSKSWSGQPKPQAPK